MIGPALVDEIEKARASGDSLRARELATSTISALSPNGALPTLQQEIEARAKLDRLLEQFGADEHALAYLDDETLVSRIEDGLALAAPVLIDSAGPLENWVIPALSALAGPCAPLLNFTLLIVVKVALAAFKSWAEKRAANFRARPSA